MQRTLAGSLFFSVLCMSSTLSANSNPLENQWQEVALGGDTMCSRGTPYSFFIHPGRTNKVVIDYLGGGACWNAETCAPGPKKTFLESIQEFKDNYKDSYMRGIYDHTNPQNPLNDWHHIVVSYCTGDIHWGENDKTYTRPDGTRFEIKHRGAVNSKAVLDWVKQNFNAPEKVLVTGCSAGAYGSAYWLPHVRKIYPNAMVQQLADSGNSPITETFSAAAYPGWNVQKNIPTWIPGLDPSVVDWSKLQLDFIYKKIADYYPDSRLAVYTSLYDSGQRFFYWVMNGDPQVWPSLTNTMLTKLGQSTSQFKHFIAPGQDHCILPYDFLYTRKGVNGESFKDWFVNYIEGGSVDNVSCPGCQEPDV